MGAPDSFVPFPTLETDRLVLRSLCLDDAPGLHAIYSDPEVTRYSARSRTLEAVRARLQGVLDGAALGTSIRWGLTLRGRDALVGAAGFWRWDKTSSRAELGYELARAEWGKGLMTEALRAIVRFGFDVMDLHSAEASVDPRNVASIRVLEKIGFRQEGLLRENLRINDAFVDTAILSLLCSDARF